jgi:hypothetical protein
VDRPTTIPSVCFPNSCLSNYIARFPYRYLASKSRGGIFSIEKLFVVTRFSIVGD